MNEPTRIAIATGGTAGHVVPAIAVADELSSRGASVFFIGADRAERELVPDAGYSLEQISVRGGLARDNPARAAAALARSAISVGRAHKLLRAGGARAVLGGGGYVAAPVLAAALGSRLPFVLTEADSHLGLTNRAFAPFARRVCLAFEIAGRSGPRYRLTGRAVPGVKWSRAAAREHLGVSAGRPCVLVFGGSLGARTINEAALSGLDGEALHVLHVTGARDWPELCGHPRGSHYDLRSYLSGEDFAAALAACDLVVARAGGSIFEIAAYGRPAILIPYPYASADHQRANAQWMAGAGAAVVIDDAQLSAQRLALEVGQALGDPARLEAMAAASLALARPHAAAEIAEEVLAAAASRRP